MTNRNLFAVAGLVMLLVIAVIASCGGGGGTAPASVGYTIGGIVSGLTGTVVLQDNGGDNLSLATNGSFTFATPLASGGTYSVTVFTQPAGQNCFVSSGTGTIALANVTGVTVTCVSDLVFSENFDGVTAPALAAGWSTSVLSGAASAWVTTTTATNVDTAPNGAFAAGAATPTDRVLNSPLFTVASTTAVLTFRNHYNLESTFDGGVLEISINAAPFTDIIAAGGTFLSSGYTSTISSNFSSPIAGRWAWTGNSGTFVTTSVQLPAAAANQPAQLRWRIGTDSSVATTGWAIDTIEVTQSW